MMVRIGPGRWEWPKNTLMAMDKLQRFLYIIIDAFLLFLEAHSSIFVRFWDKNQMVSDQLPIYGAVGMVGVVVIG